MAEGLQPSNSPIYFAHAWFVRPFYYIFLFRSALF
jgi:hypothetical protein